MAKNYLDGRTTERREVSPVQVNTLDETSSVNRILRTNYTIGPSTESLKLASRGEFPQPTDSIPRLNLNTRIDQ